MKYPINELFRQTSFIYKNYSKNIHDAIELVFHQKDWAQKKINDTIKNIQNWFTARNKHKKQKVICKKDKNQAIVRYKALIKSTGFKEQRRQKKQKKAQLEVRLNNKQQDAIMEREFDETLKSQKSVQKPISPTFVKVREQKSIPDSVYNESNSVSSAGYIQHPPTYQQPRLYYQSPQLSPKQFQGQNFEILDKRKKGILDDKELINTNQNKRKNDIIDSFIIDTRLKQEEIEDQNLISQEKSAHYQFEPQDNNLTKQDDDTNFKDEMDKKFEEMENIMTSIYKAEQDHQHNSNLKAQQQSFYEQFQNARYQEFIQNMMNLKNEIRNCMNSYKEMSDNFQN
ncbi:UNKNOWN [Stylonychia lemnae]|uniref:Uncharacterized protein n=1 Tax=Stylonychia lemnae TaxID=5949 RepID=A0A078BBF9_STYLE|nr:UNKNOWN [Stylonychia lemnae]|eukprot:CDW90602.1 UNKNOWN [Stylonychia lemnae]